MFSVAMLCSTFSTTMMASSTTRPMAQDHAEPGQHVVEKPEHVDAGVGADDGDRHGQIGMMVARKDCRRGDHQHHRITASKKVCTTFSMEASVNLAGVEDDLVVQALRELGFNSSMSARTCREVSMALAPAVVDDRSLQPFDH